MKYLCAVLMSLAVLMLCVSCTNGDNSEKYVYYFAVDGNEENEGVILHAIMKRDDGKKDSEKNALFAEIFDGADVKEVFDIFFERYKDVYTGTVKEYAVSIDLGRKVFEDFKVYLANSPRLPVKKSTVKVENAEEYISEKLVEQSE